MPQSSQTHVPQSSQTNDSSTVPPRTERSYWLAITDALNGAESAGMPVGIDLDGTLTDHNAWSVVWDRDARQWVLAGYDSESSAEITPRHTPDPWAPIFRLVGWLDRQNGRSQHEISLRLLKLVEESGEVAQAYIGSVGQNPRKGVTHTSADVADELCDVIITAMVALVSVADGNPDDILAAKLAKVAERAADSEGGAR